ncbi:MAG: tRNA (guanosine(37)-N1)-methyltransferase TrmD [bacterium]|nr:tRNA (guanosine(37)-N1)-methyltransferase TrmD [bacterium]
MVIDVLTLFPEPVSAILRSSILERAEKSGIVEYRCHQLRDWATGKHRPVDDIPFGGTAGMVLKPEPLCSAVDELRATALREGQSPYVIFPTPDGVPYTQEIAKSLSKRSRLLFVCGRYKGVDERFRATRVDCELSLGDFVLTGGEIPTLAMIDSIVRLIPGVLNDFESAEVDSFYDAPLLDCEWYTRPWEFEGMTPPEVLRNGNHAAIEAWRSERRKRRTSERRPDLLNDF